MHTPGSRLGTRVHTHEGSALGIEPCPPAPVALDHVTLLSGCHHKTLGDVSAHVGVPDPALSGNRSAGMQTQCLKSGDAIPVPPKPFKMPPISVWQQPSRKYMAPAPAL